MIEVNQSKNNIQLKKENDKFERGTIKKELDEKMVFLNDQNYMNQKYKESLKDVMSNCSIQDTKVVNISTSNYFEQSMSKFISK